MSIPRNKSGASVAIFAVLLFANVSSGQQYPSPANAAPGQQLSAQQLDDLVAPIALYPDPLLGEVLAASTYPMEIAEAEQWVQDHRQWKPSKLMDQAKKQNWDPSVQGLVAFPQVLARMIQDMGWTTQLGNAFLAQQPDVMSAVQRMRAQAQARGKLQSTPQQQVTTDNQGGQRMIDIQPANPDVWYVPDYNPAYVWGPPVYGFYPPLIYPGIDVGFGWGPGIDLGLYFGGWGGWGWGGWGWSPNWYGGSIILNQSFFHRYGFNHFHENGLGSMAWTHDPGHRLGVPYGNREVAGRFAGQARGGQAGFNSGAARGGQAGFNSGADRGRQQERMGSPGFEQRGFGDNHGAFGGYHNGGQTRMQSDHGFSSMGAGRTAGGGGFGGAGGGGMRGGGGGGGGGMRGGGRGGH
jgi:hypothetical protein